MSSPRGREPFSLSEQVRNYIKIYAPRPELRRMDTVVGNTTLKNLHGLDHFNQDKKTEINLLSDTNLFRHTVGPIDGNGNQQVYECNMAVPNDFRTEFSLLLTLTDGTVVAQCSNLADLGVYDVVNTIEIGKAYSDTAFYFIEFFSTSSEISWENWVGNTFHIKSPVPFQAVELYYLGYGKKYYKDQYGETTSISWIDFLYPELVALSIAQTELKLAGYQQEAANLEAERKELVRSFLVDQAEQTGGASHG